MRAQAHLPLGGNKAQSPSSPRHFWAGLRQIISPRAARTEEPCQQMSRASNQECMQNVNHVASTAAHARICPQKAGSQPKELRFTDENPITTDGNKNRAKFQAQ